MDIIETLELLKIPYVILKPGMDYSKYSETVIILIHADTEFKQEWLCKPVIHDERD